MLHESESRVDAPQKKASAEIVGAHRNRGLVRDAGVAHAVPVVGEPAGEASNHYTDPAAEQRADTRYRRTDAKPGAGSLAGTSGYERVRTRHHATVHARRGSHGTSVTSPTVPAWSRVRAGTKR